MKRAVKIGLRRVEYTLICSKNRNTLLLQALPDDKIRVYAPAYVGLREVDAFVKERMADIDAAHKRLREAHEIKKTAMPSEIMLGGRRAKVEIIHAERCRISVYDDLIKVETPYTAPDEIKAQIKRALIQHALKKLRFYLDKHAPSIGKPYGRVTVREQKTRWGSCSSKQNLNFNWKLIMAPEQALEYVVIHELCHLICFNHSENFWREVAKRMPDYDIWKKWLKKHGCELTLD